MSYPPPYPPPPQQYYPPQQPQYYPPPQTAGTYSPAPSGQYNQPPTYEHNYSNYGREPEYGQVHSTVAEKWNRKPKFQDLWAVILFIIHFIGFIVLSYIGIKELMNKKNQNNTSPNNPNDPNNPDGTPNIEIKLDSASLIALLVVVGIFGFVISLLYMLLMQRFPKPLIRITLYLSIAFYFAAAAAFALFKQYISAIFLAIFGIFYLICAFTWRDRIPFAAILLETITTLTKKYYGTIIMGFVGLIVQVGWSIWWIVTLIGAKDKFCEEVPDTKGGTSLSCSQPTIYVLLYLVFSFYWTSQVIKTIIHVTDAGVFATFYFLEGTPQGTGSVPTLSSLKRACTTSIGSICYGSLIIAILNTTRFILRSFARGDDGVCGFIAACLECLLSWIESLVQYFNHYAYVQVAIYGKSYCESAKDTWRLIKDRGVEAIINDNLIGNVLAMGAIFIGALCALFGFGYIHLFLKITDGTTIFILVIISFFLGFMMTVVITDVIDSGVTTTFVALAEDPNALKRTKPQLFERIRREWPRVVQGM
ncbi:plasma-membrane choline transporter-domain-containing protein [Glomus cerebriforme]|uniref:Protein PNS1 n=1 Tax=Glomus cerebriforme TaxID=658196 RepID=A0A397SXI5_9GLOM|nr:plasma-membrane choline transporter-domain-containing protein [Glomus cerebriforme]